MVLLHICYLTILRLPENVPLLLASVPFLPSIAKAFACRTLSFIFTGEPMDSMIFKTPKQRVMSWEKWIILSTF